MKSREISVASRVEVLVYDEAQVFGLFAFLDAIDGLSVPNGELSVVFLSDAELADLHSRFLDDPSVTDVITFPGDESDGMAGEICVSVDRALEVAGSNPEAFSAELSLYLIHGWLHLAGYDDLEEEARALMHARQDEVLRSARDAASLPAFEVVS